MDSLLQGVLPRRLSGLFSFHCLRIKCFDMWDGKKGNLQVGEERREERQKVTQ